MHKKSFLVFGAHPDDPDIRFGGTALLLTRAGHDVRFVSMTNGNRGHHLLPPNGIAATRRKETQASARIAGLSEYRILNHDDTRLASSLALRDEVLRIVREYAPDVVLSPRPYDYHPDHRATAQAVCDTAYLVQVPHCCPEVPPLTSMPIYAYLYDPFTDPSSFRVDAAVMIDAVFTDKMAMYACHASQFFEWLPWIDLGMKNFDASALTEKEKEAFLIEHWGQPIDGAIAEYARSTLVATYGDSGKNAAYAEAFALSPYGRSCSKEEFRHLFIPDAP